MVDKNDKDIRAELLRRTGAGDLRDPQQRLSGELGKAVGLPRSCGSGRTLGSDLCRMEYSLGETQTIIPLVTFPKI